MDNMNLSSFSNEEIVSLYSNTIKELKNRKIIRTKNVLGDLAEFLAIKYYCETPGLPNLQAAPIGTQNVDALSRAGDRYSIKATTGNVTGIFTGLEPKDSLKPDKQKFEYVLICKFDDNYQLKTIYELSWEMFVKHKRWHKTMQAWNIFLSKEVMNDAIIHIVEENDINQDNH